MKRRLIFLVLLFAFGVFDVASSPLQEQKPAWDGNQTVPVHLMPLRDEFDQPIVPTASYSLPFSSRFSCAPCHDYSFIAQGQHFNPLAANLSGRAGEPWFWVEEKSGTVLPLSFQKNKGTWAPMEVGLTSWDFALLFGRHMTGGGILELANEDMSPDSRWNVSGKIEINCLACHNASRIQSHSEWAKQILRHNFRWAATAASGLGEVGGMASRLPATWDLFDGPNPDDTEWAVVPSVQYNPGLFDSKHRVFLDIAPKPEDQRCLVCHSVTPVDAGKQDFDADIHSASGLACVDCHRNSLDHVMTRGYEGEAGSGDEDRGSLTCAGCHLGPETKGRRSLEAGRLGAPYPQHYGLPPVHLERLACTVCHSGPLPGKDPVRVRTSRANRLGIYGVAQWMTEMPWISEPVYQRNGQGKIAPYRLVWPSYWASIENGEVFPIPADEILDLIGEVLSSEERVAQLLLALYRASDLGGTPVLISGGRIFELNVDGGLDVLTGDGLPVSPNFSWGIKTDEEIEPLVPEFDPQAEMLDLDLETRIYEVLDALETVENAPGKPALLMDKVLFHSVEGYLEKKEYEEGDVGFLPQLCWFSDGHVIPLIDDDDLRTILITADTQYSLTEEQVVLALEVLDSERKTGETEGEKRHVYISGGRMFELDVDGRLNSIDHVAAEPVTWPLGHRVRPAQQSLGFRGCRDCHRADSPFFFGKVRGEGPLFTMSVESRTQSAFMGLNQPYQRLFGLSFSVRPVLKAVLFVAVALLGSLLLLLVMLVIGRMTGLVNRER
jgi:hypothetical protein